MVTIELGGVEGQEDDDASLSATGVAAINDILVGDLMMVTSQQKWRQCYVAIMTVTNQASNKAASSKYAVRRHPATYE